LYPSVNLHPVLAAALEAFAERGYHGASVRDIAQRVGVSVPALYYHYENKQAMLFSLLESSMREVLDRCRAAAAEVGQDPVERFSAMVECIVLYMCYRRDAAFLDAEARSLEPEHRARYVALRDYLEHMMLDSVEAGNAQGRFNTPYPADATRAVLSMCQGVTGWYRLDGPLEPSEVAERYLGFCLGALGHAAEPRPAAGTRSGRATGRAGTRTRRPLA
jgi:AcrR family transcriptional regulator